MLTDSIITVDGLPVHVRSSGFSERFVLFIHGNSCSADFWDNQLSDRSLQKDFQLIAIDLPGHGSSGRTNDYSLNYLAGSLVRIIQELSLDTYILAGLSYGTALIAEASSKLRNCRGFFLASPNITSDQFPPTSYIIPFPELFTMISAEVDSETLRRFASHLTGDADSPLVEQFCKSYMKTDPQFRTDLGLAMQNMSWSDEFKNLIETGLPVSYLFGEKDEAMNIHYMESAILPENHNFQYLDNSAHFININQPEKYNDLLRKFCEKAYI